MKGMTLMELVIAMAISAILLTGLVQIAAGARSSFRLQDALAEVQESGRFALDTLGSVLHQSDFRPEPWKFRLVETGIIDGTADQVSSTSDRIVIRTWSDRNCFGTLNSVPDASGQPAFFIREQLLDQSGSNQLAHTCRYGPAMDALVTQINHQGVVKNVESFQLLLAEDQDGDRSPDRWINGSERNALTPIVGLRIGLLLSSEEPVTEPSGQSFNVLDRVVSPGSDGRLRSVFVYSQALPIADP